MKKMLSQGLLTAAVISLGLSVAAQAQVTTTQVTAEPVCTRVITVPTGTLSGNTQLTTSCAQTTSSASMTAAPVVTSQEIVMGPYGTTAGATTALPRLSTGTGNLELHLLNPSPNPLSFSIPELSVSHVVPANSERVVYLDSATLASLTPGREISYYITDSSGNRLASSMITNDQIVYSSTTTLSQSQTTAVEEVSTEEVQPAERSSTVRGFW